MVYVSRAKIEQQGSTIEPWHNKALSFLIQLLRRKEVPRNLRILDVGCGKGEALKYILTRLRSELKIHVEAFAVDIIEEYNKYLKEAGISFKVCDVSFERLPFKDSYFDIVLAFEVLEHLLVPENLLKEANRVLKRDGIMVLSTPNLRWWVNIMLLLLGYQPYIPDTGFYRNYGTL